MSKQLRGMINQAIVPRSNHRTDLSTFAALDALPPELFREIGFSARVWDAPTILDLYTGAQKARGHNGAVGWLIASMRYADEQDVFDFGFKYQTRYKSPLPHLAAEASVLRYQEPVGVRRMVLHRGARPKVKAAWAASERLLPRVVAPV